MRERHSLLKVADGTAFLTALTLYASFRKAQSESSAVTCKRKDVLELVVADYQRLADEMEYGFKKAAQLLAEEKIFDPRFLPYATQLIPLSCICAALSIQIDNASIKEKVLRWYWCGVFGELYGGANETRFSQDLPDVVDWVNGGDTPRTVKDASFAPRRLLSLQTRISAAYKGLSILLMQRGGKDFISATPIAINAYFVTPVDIHHVFPKAWCTAKNLPREKWNSVINKTPLSTTTNQYLSGDAPSLYLKRIEEKKGVPSETLDACLRSHAIPVEELRQNAFDDFIRQRAILLLDMIEAATGKAVSGRDSDETVMAFVAALLFIFLSIDAFSCALPCYRAPCCPVTYTGTERIRHHGSRPGGHKRPSGRLRRIQGLRDIPAVRLWVRQRESGQGMARQDQNAPAAGHAA